MMRRTVLFATAATVAVLVAACATSPLGRSQFIVISDDSINAQGVASYQQMQKEMPATKDARASRYVNCIAQAVTAQVPTLREKGELAVPASGTYTVQTSPNLVTWTNVPSSVVGNTVEYTPATGQGKVFVRLLVVPN